MAQELPIPKNYHNGSGSIGLTAIGLFCLNVWFPYQGKEALGVTNEHTHGGFKCDGK